MEVNRDFIEAGKKNFASVPLTEMPIDPAIKQVKAERGTITIEMFKAEKIEKLVFSTIKIHESGVVETSILGWPESGYDFPILWCNVTQMPSIMNIAVFDFIPLMDIVVWPEYAEKYIAGISDLKAKALESFGDTIIDKEVDLPSLTVLAFSPYKAVIKISEDGLAQVPKVTEEYIKTYVRYWEEAQPLVKREENVLCKQRKEAVRNLMKANDPGYPFMVAIFGEETTQKVFDLVF